jgi:hypothetical protein
MKQHQIKILLIFILIATSLKTQIAEPKETSHKQEESDNSLGN